MFFLVNIFFTQPQISIEKWIPTPGQKLYKRIPFSCHTCPLPLLWYDFHNCLCNFLQCKVSCCLHMYFLWRHHLLINRKMIKIVFGIDIYDWWHCFSVFSIERVMLWKWSFVFSTHSKFCLYPTLSLRRAISVPIELFKEIYKGGISPKPGQLHLNSLIHWKKIWKSIEGHRMEIVWTFIGNRMDFGYA